MDNLGPVVAILVTLSVLNPGWASQMTSSESWDGDTMGDDSGDHTGHPDDSHMTTHVDDGHMTTHVDDGHMTTHMHNGHMTTHMDDHMTTHMDDGHTTTHTDDGHMNTHPDERQMTSTPGSNERDDRKNWWGRRPSTRFYPRLPWPISELFSPLFWPFFPRSFESPWSRDSRSFWPRWSPFFPRSFDDSDSSSGWPRSRSSNPFLPRSFDDRDSSSGWPRSRSFNPFFGRRFDDSGSSWPFGSPFSPRDSSSGRPRSRLFPPRRWSDDDLGGDHSDRPDFLSLRLPQLPANQIDDRSITSRSSGFDDSSNWRRNSLLGAPRFDSRSFGSSRLDPWAPRSSSWPWWWRGDSRSSGASPWGSDPFTRSPGFRSFPLFPSSGRNFWPWNRSSGSPDDSWAWWRRNRFPWYRPRWGRDFEFSDPRSDDSNDFDDGSNRFFENTFRNQFIGRVPQRTADVSPVPQQIAPIAADDSLATAVGGVPASQ